MKTVCCLKRGNQTDKGIPTSYKSRETLVHFLTKVIFTSSCQHAAVNFSQLNDYGFAQNSPLLLRKPPPEKKGEVGLQCTMESLSNKHQSCVAIVVAYNLTRIYPTEVKW